MSNPATLGVNIDHVATLRQARGTRYPDPVYAAQIAEQSGADSITFHLREDLRHIQKRDALLLKQVVQTKLNLEIAVTPEMLKFACDLRAEDVCLVPEKREELTTEGGLDVAAQIVQMREACTQLADVGTRVSPFIDASFEQIDAVIDCGAPCVEIHTGHYADASGIEQQKILAWIDQALVNVPGQLIKYTRKLETLTRKRQKVENLLNLRPRKILKFQTPLEVFKMARFDLSVVALHS